MIRQDFATQAIILAALVAIAVGLSVLIPHVRTYHLTSVELNPAPESGYVPIRIHLTGTVHEGVYTLDESDSIYDVLRLLADERETPPTEIHISTVRGHESRSPQRIDLNHAEPWLLQALPGIGAERAHAIVAHRDLHGPFNSTGELKMVSGIGTATYEGLKEFVTVTP